MDRGRCKCSLSTIGKTLKAMGLTIKKREFRQMEKFSSLNVKKMEDILATVSQIPTCKLRFFDECGVSRKALGSTHARAYEGHRALGERKNGGRKHFTVVALTCSREGAPPLV